MKKTLGAFVVIHSVLSVAEIGKLIRTERKRQKILQQDLADLSGVSLHFLSNLENGKKSVEFQKVLHIFRSLGIKMELTTRQVAEDHSWISREMALSVGSETDPGQIRNKNWLILAEELEIRPALLRKTVLHIAKQLEENIYLWHNQFIQLQCDDPVLGHINQLIVKQIRRTKKLLEEEWINITCILQPGIQQQDWTLLHIWNISGYYSTVINNSGNSNK